MGIFRKLFGKSEDSRSLPEPDVSVVLPYETLTVAGTEAVSTEIDPVICRGRVAHAQQRRLPLEFDM